MSKTKWLRELARARQLDIKELEKEYLEALESLKAKGVAGDLNTIAKNILMAKHRELRPFRRKRKYPLANFVGFKIGDLGLQDDAQRMREWARFVIERDGLDYAKEQGLVEEREDSIVVLDTRRTIFGRPNKNYGKPLPPTLKLRRRDIILLAKQADDDSFEFTRLQTKDNKLAVAWGQLPFHTPVAFPKKWAEENLTPIEDVMKYHEATKEAWDRWILVKGVVASINAESESFRGIPCLLIDSEAGYEAEKSVLFYVPEHLKLSFGTYSEIYVLGKTRGITAIDEETKQKYTADVVIDAWGFMPVPGKSTSPESSLLEPEEEEEEEIKGFIPAE